MLCFDIASLLDRAVEYWATDIHLIYDPVEQKAKAIFRSGRKFIQSEEWTEIQWVAIVEALKFHSHYHTENRHQFQDADLQLDHHSLRIAFSPDPTHYVTIRRHQRADVIGYEWTVEQARFLDDWRRSHQLLVIVGPIHSGKTTLYYQILSQESQMRFSVMSLEDPVEKSGHSFFQMACRQPIQQTVSALMRFDLDVVGLGELRRDPDWRALNFLSLSGVRLLTTCHAKNIVDLKKKVELVDQHCVSHWNEWIFGFIVCHEVQQPLHFYRASDVLV